MISFPESLYLAHQPQSISPLVRSRDKRVDVYIARSADFARPILKHLRQVVHKACPDVEETLKWNFPVFMYKGMLCTMAAFKEHAVFGFWKQKLMRDPNKFFQTADIAMGNLGRLASVSDLPPKKILSAYIKEAVALNEEGTKVPRNRKVPKKPLRMPQYLKRALVRNKKALVTFEAFSPTHKREYLEWVTEAKTEETRSKRLATTIDWLAQGKKRNWKYMR